MNNLLCMCHSCLDPLYDSASELFSSFLCIVSMVFCSRSYSLENCVETDITGATWMSMRP